MERMIQVEKENVEQSVFVEREPMTLNIGGTTDYNGLSNKPSINGTTLSGDKSLSDLGIQPAGSYVNESSYNAKINEIEGTLSSQGTSIASLSNDKADKSEMPTKTSDLTNDSGFITDYTETDPTVPGHVKNITQANITSWNNKSDFSGNYNDLTNKPTMPTVPTSLSAFTDDLGSSPTHTHSQYLTSHQDISGKEDRNNKVTSISSSSTDTQYPSAKCVYDIVGDVEAVLTTLTTGNGV